MAFSLKTVVLPDPEAENPLTLVWLFPSKIKYWIVAPLILELVLIMAVVTAPEAWRVAYPPSPRNVP
jgi:hypothetical protein